MRLKSAGVLSTRSEPITVVVEPPVYPLIGEKTSGSAARASGRTATDSVTVSQFAGLATSQIVYVISTTAPPAALGMVTSPEAVSSKIDG